MTAPKRFHQTKLTREKDFAVSTSTLVGTIVSPTTENLQSNELIDLKKQTHHFESHQKKSQSIPNHFESRSKNKQKIVNVTETQSINDEDDWVCPVAVLLRRAGYNVPLRPSKSWLERDRKQQALLRERQTFFKEM